MTLLSALQTAKTALFATQAGIQVTANNIANADTPGYVRERLVQAPGPAQRAGNLVLGTGVQLEGVERQVDRFLQQRTRAAASDLANGEVRERAYVDLESVLGELSDSDLSTALTDFFAGLHDALTQPEDLALRRLAVLGGESLASQFRQMGARVQALRATTNDRVADAVKGINQAVTEVAKLNAQIVHMEQGGAIFSDAVGLRDKRDKALDELAKIVNIQVEEQANGAVNVFVGGDYLVFDGMTRLVETVRQADRGLGVYDVRLGQTNAQLRASSGELAGLLGARDQILGGYLDELNSFASTLIFEFNKVHASGQGLTGHRALSSERGVSDPTAPLDAAGLPFTPVHGSLRVETVNARTGVRQSHDVSVQLMGLEDDTTLASLAGALSAIEGVAAEVTLDGRLTLRATSDDLQLALADDTSGVLAALGLNTFFTGTSAVDMGVQSRVRDDPAALALSRGGLGADARNGERLAGLLTTPLDSAGQTSLAHRYEQWVSGTAQASALSQAVTAGYRLFHSTLEGEHLGLSGVSLDEEAVRMMTLQRTFQAAAKVISTVNELLEVLVQL